MVEIYGAQLVSAHAGRRRGTFLSKSPRSLGQSSHCPAESSRTKSGESSESPQHPHWILQRRSHRRTGVYRGNRFRFRRERGPQRPQRSAFALGAKPARTFPRRITLKAGRTLLRHGITAMIFSLDRSGAFPRNVKRLCCRRNSRRYLGRMNGLPAGGTWKHTQNLGR